MNNIPEAIAMVEGETGKKADVQYGVLVTDDGRYVHAAWVTSDEGDQLDNDNTEDDE